MLWHVPGLAGCVDKGLSRGQDRVWLDLTQAAVCGKKEKKRKEKQFLLGAPSETVKCCCSLFNINLIYISGICQESKNVTAISSCTHGETGIVVVIVRRYCSKTVSSNFLWSWSLARGGCLLLWDTCSNRVLKWWRHKNKIFEIIGYDAIFL